MSSTQELLSKICLLTSLRFNQSLLLIMYSLTLKILNSSNSISNLETKTTKNHSEEKLVCSFWEMLHQVVTTSSMVFLNINSRRKAPILLVILMVSMVLWMTHLSILPKLHLLHIEILEDMTTLVRPKNI